MKKIIYTKKNSMIINNFDNFILNENMMIKDTHKKDFIKALNTLFYSWGGDTPPEVFWGTNELLDWYEKVFQVDLGNRFDEENFDDDNFGNFVKVIDSIKRS